jgi:hypothetical protein
MKSSGTLLEELIGAIRSAYKGKFDGLEEWTQTDLSLTCCYGETYGRIKYGVRVPMAPSTTSIIECEPKTKEKIRGETPKYWFIDRKNQGTVCLLKVISIKDHKLIAKVRSGSENFNAHFKRT